MRWRATWSANNVPGRVILKQERMGRFAGLAAGTQESVSKRDNRRLGPAARGVLRNRRAAGWTPTRWGDGGRVPHGAGVRFRAGPASSLIDQVAPGPVSA